MKIPELTTYETQPLDSEELFFHNLLSEISAIKGTEEYEQKMAVISSVFDDGSSMYTLVNKRLDYHKVELDAILRMWIAVISDLPGKGALYCYHAARLTARLGRPATLDDWNTDFPSCSLSRKGFYQAWSDQKSEDSNLLDVLDSWNFRVS